MKNNIWVKISNPKNIKFVILFPLLTTPIALSLSLRDSSHNSVWGFVCISFSVFLISGFLTASIKANEYLVHSRDSGWKIKLVSSSFFPIAICIGTFLTTYFVWRISNNYWITIFLLLLGSGIITWQENITTKFLNLKESPLNPTKLLD